MAEILSLEERLAQQRAASADYFGPEALALRQQMIADLERSHVAHALAVGDTAPDFTLRTAHSGETVTLSASVQGGPVVLSFYRGHW